MAACGSGWGTLGQIVGGRSGELGVTAVVTLVSGRVMPSACVRGAPRSWRNRNSPAIHPAGVKSASRFQSRVRWVGSEPDREICAPAGHGPCVARHSLRRSNDP